MKYYFICTLSLCLTTHAMEAPKEVFGKRVLTMPAKNILQERLKENNITCISDQVLDRLAEKEIYPEAVEFVLSGALLDQCNYSFLEVADMMSANPQLFEALIDDQWALDELQRKEYYHPRPKKKLKLDHI